jgi:N-acetylglutamate synthase/N-acetylornithine aminotransferase
MRMVGVARDALGMHLDGRTRLSVKSPSAILCRTQELLWMGKCRQTIDHCAPNGAGALEAPEIDEETDKESYPYRVFRDELTAFTRVLVVRDGEGATRKFVKITVQFPNFARAKWRYDYVSSLGAPHYENAHAIASKISTSALVKTALCGRRHHSFQVI